MTTDAVRMYCIHCLTQLEKSFKSYGPLLIDAKEVALLHYKIAPIVTGDIWGQLNIENNRTKEALECLDFRRYSGYTGDLQSGYYHSSNNQVPRGHFIQNIGVNPRNIIDV